MIKNTFCSVFCFALLLCGCTEKKVPEFSKSELRPGGDTTLKRINTRTFIHPSENLDLDQQLDFWDGFSFFRDPWVAAPAATTDRDGLGPLYNARSCKACHIRGGRGKLVGEGIHSPMALLFRLGHSQNGDAVDKHYGGQFQPFAIKLAKPASLVAEGKVKIQYETLTGHYADGTAYQLTKPSYQLVDLGYGELEPSTVLSPRYAPALYGMGLLDAISEADLLSQQDINDQNKDGISAKYNRVVNPKTQQRELGRFGFKASQVSLASQTAAAFVNDIGITNPLFTQDTCTQSQLLCQQASFMGGHDTALEIPEKLHKLTVFMGAHVAVQPTRKLTSKKAQQGRALFYLANCHSCHTPSYTTQSDYPIKELANQTIWPYTNLALHDMGEGLADHKAEGLANGREWRTPPLWGIGLQQKVQGYQAFLHDGRAKTIAEAILWHGGEAEQAKLAFVNFDQQQRDALIYFLKQI
ncbi:di-heme oxidoreductase family protein [Pseudoalteromonas sp. G4]|uniref:di-heme oxidoreductase family protein n=1 Tax=Pseudoalteromonas sp. G4 TaxID=2992761 RepID=UPI00237D8AF3|nr:di-heme oxidoredictase family protein [Pseudoalteromonas sp. G4]MDE3273141.1 c-type cytochrome [Pseudoalteromonas sp. G4]